MTSIDCTKPTASPKFVSVGVRLAFVIWLYVVTDGYAFSAFTPLSFLGDVVGGSIWQPALAVVGLGQVLVRVVGKHRSPDAEDSRCRAAGRRRRRPADLPAVPRHCSTTSSRCGSRRSRNHRSGNSTAA